MAVARWRMMRIWAMEKANLQYEMSKDQTPGRDAPTRAGLAFRKLCDESRSVDLLGRYETRHDRQYCRALNLLMKKKALAPNPAPPASDPGPLQPAGTILPFKPNPKTEQPRQCDIAAVNLPWRDPSGNTRLTGRAG